MDHQQQTAGAMTANPAEDDRRLSITAPEGTPCFHFVVLDLVVHFLSAYFVKHIVIIVECKV